MWRQVPSNFMSPPPPPPRPQILTFSGHDIIKDPSGADTLHLQILYPVLGLVRRSRFQQVPSGGCLGLNEPQEDLGDAYAAFWDMCWMECVNGLLFTKAFTPTVCLPPCSARFRSKGLSRSSAMHMPTWRARAMDALFHGAENSLAHAFSSRPGPWMPKGWARAECCTIRLLYE